MSDLVVIGKVSSARGLKGQFKIISYTKNAEDIFNYGPITIGDKYIDVQLSKVSTTKNSLVASVHEIDTREKAEDIINNNITVKNHKFPEISEDGQYYYYQIKSMKVIDESCKIIGEVMNIANYGANDVIEIIDKNKKTFFIPYSKNVIDEVDVKNNILKVKNISDYQ